MRTAPPIGISVRRFGAWNGAVLLLAAAAGAALAGWALARSEPFETWRLAAVAAAALAALLLLGAPLRRRDAVVLSWDGRSWHLGPTGSTLTAGDLDVAIDLGVWLLLRFTEAAPAARRTRPRVQWLPVQRRGGLEPQWHALRCAVFGPKPSDAA